MLRAVRGVRRRRDHRGGRDDHRRRTGHARRTGHQEPAPATPARARAHPARDARDDPRLCRASASPPRPMSRPCARTTTATTSRSPSATEPTARFGAPAPRSTSPGWTPRSTTSARPSAGRSRSPSAEQALAMAAALGCYWEHAKPLRRGRGLGRAGPEPAGRRRRSGAARPRSAHEGHVPLASGARSRATRGRGRDGGHRPTAWRSRDSSPKPSRAASITRSMPSGSMSRTHSPTRRSTGPEPPTTTGRSPKRPAERRSRRPASPICASASTQPPRCSLTSATSTSSRTSSTAAAYAALCLGSERDAADFAARATPITRALDNRYARMINSGNLGLAALLTGETDTASQAFREELTLCREMVVRPVAFEGLRGLAAVATVRRRRQARRDTRRRRRRTPLRRTPRIRSRPGSNERSSSPPAHATEQTHGMPPRAKAARSASRTRSPTPSKNPPASPETAQRALHATPRPQRQRSRWSHPRPPAAPSA